MKTLKLIALTVCGMATQVQAAAPWLEALDHPDKADQMALRWNAYGGEADLQLFYGMLDDMGIHVDGMPAEDKDAWNSHHRKMAIKNLSGLELQVPYGNLQAVTDGVLFLQGELNFVGRKGPMNVSQLRVVPSKRKVPRGEIVVMEVLDGAGNNVFLLDHVHAVISPEKTRLELKNMDVRASEWLAGQLGHPEMAGWVIGQMHISNHLNIPQGAITDIKTVDGAGCAVRPIWPPVDADADVQLIGMTPQWRRNLSGDRIVITPSATLKNVGSADVPWHSKFSGTFDPYGNDQHPFLNWAMYREVDGRFEQIGRSGIKHAFLTINSNCTLDCGDSHILWPGCEDVYGVGTNDSGGSLGPRDEVESFLGLWESTGSFFDPGSTGSQTNSSNSTDENRMIVEEADITNAANDYYVSAWYTIRDDVNIFNTMGFRKVNLFDNGGSWTVSTTTALTNGSASEAYVPVNTLDAVAGLSHQRLTTTEGHLAVAVKVEDLGGGEFRYNYMVENFDFDPKVEAVSLPLGDFAQFTGLVFSDLDQSGANDWNFAVSSGVLSATAVPGNEMDWGMIYSFSFTTDSAPMVGMVNLSGADTKSNVSMKVQALVPQPSDQIYLNSFE